MRGDAVLTHWIANEAVEGAGQEVLEIQDPADESVVAEAPRGDPEDVDRAVTAARGAWPAWSALGPAGRRAALLEAADRLQQHGAEIAELLVRENGKPLAEAKGEVGAAVAVTRSFAELAVHVRSGAQMPPSTELNFQHRQARGVAACIVPWNFPVALATENVVPNLAVGNTVVLKPSEKTPVATRRLAELAFGHLPPGVCNVVLGDGSAGAPLVAHPQVDVVVFVGSEATGRQIARVCGQDLRKAVVELGGKDVFIVDEGVDIERAVSLAVAAKYTASGQICTSTEHFLVQERVFEQFLDRFVARSTEIRVGSGLDEGIQMGPLIDELQRGKVIQQVQSAREAGAEVHCGGAVLDRPGYFYPPTVLTGVGADTPLRLDETFGPVAPVEPFQDFEQAVAVANSSRFGLAAIVCTESAPHALHAIHALQAGMVKVNTIRGKAPGATSEPFKSSGLGHGYGLELLHELTVQKSIHWRAQL